MMAAGAGAPDHEPDRGDVAARAVAPGQVPLKALQIIQQWHVTALSREALALEYYDYDMLARMRASRQNLDVMRTYIVAGLPVHIFALTTASGTGNIRAMAMVKDVGPVGLKVHAQGLKLGSDLGGVRVEHVVDLITLVTTPDELRPDGATATELVRTLVSWAKAVGYKLSIKPSNPFIYKTLGFEMIEGFEPQMLHTGGGEWARSKPAKFNLIRLKV